MLLDGLQLPLTTPFYPDGRLNLHKLEHNVSRYSKTPAAGLVALCDAGEPTLLSEEETRHVLRTVVAAAAAEKVLIAGVSRDSVVGTLELAESAAEFGYDVVLVKRPLMLRGTGERTKELMSYFQAVGDRSALPVVLYCPASDEGSVLPAEVVIELAGHSKVLGMVDGLGDRERMEAIKTGTARYKRDVTVTGVFAAVTGRMQSRSEGAEAKDLILATALTDGGAAVATPSKTVAKTRTKAVGFQVLAGRTDGMFEGLKSGAVGAMPAFAAAAPQACYEVLAAWKDGDEGLAQEKQMRLQDVAARIEKQMGVGGIKFGCDLNGYFGGRPRLPWLPLSGEARAEIEALMQGIRN
ncbi:dihydrodipicolinate synthase family protein [Tunturiibacter gelidoferens]|uniref:Dihydrodipicolinate synthase/N-acetylneuraminate lyase n=1 Tax=Tunturiibacter gelidiferens TaxID=3069689 RepID=A0ACC5NVJ2_9BACT|nr:dihydrodipicolinate synthase family protein [Edaphobacter lichenicola]MBB5338579.1 dihydrodipicolinate synthase/N-acetylneuraminate lyase [Edaphobacter lichenicola]